ncbi:peroxin 8 [Xylariomycetidae sp. FL0641]|nr:peroxin 8 [Xylariomycetidae sp. FL0641]
MPADRLLNRVLQAYQDPPPRSSTETDKILGTTNALLASLTNPLNLSLLTTHFLTARALWPPADGLRACHRVLGIYHTAAGRVRQNELENDANRGGRLAWGAPHPPPVGSGVSAEKWARAVAKGLDERSERWQHLLVLAGVLVGMEADERKSLSWSLRSTLEQAVVTAANLALEDPVRTGPLGRGAVVLALTYAFPLLADHHKRLLNGNALVPAVVETMLGDEGFQRAAFVLSISRDITASLNASWYADSPSAIRLQNLASRPVVQNMGPLSLLAGFAIENATDTQAILQAQDELLAFTTALLGNWQGSALSQIDVSAAAARAPEPLAARWEMLWQLLRKILFTVVGTLQPIVGQTLLDPRLRNDATAPVVASKTLHALRNLSFISSHQGTSSFQVYAFTYLTSLDILNRYPDASVAFLQATLPPPPPADYVPSPSAQALTLFYLNTAEHLPLALPTSACESLVVGPATAHLAPTCWLSSLTTTIEPLTTVPLARDLFEAAHSATLAALSCPQHSLLTAELVPFYIDALLGGFPALVSPRQFRLAFRVVLQIACAPFPLAASHPQLAETLLEILRARAERAGTASLPSKDEAGGDEILSEQVVLILALIDALPHAPYPLLDDWLTRTAQAAATIPDPVMRATARKRFVDVLSNGELDVERGVVGVAWWGTKGGRELVLGREAVEAEAPMMSGALGGARGESRL